MDAMEWTLPGLVSVVGGILTVAIGTFVLYASPRAWMARAFFVLTLFDGISTIMITLHAMAIDPQLSVNFESAYWATFIPFVALLALVGFCFPLSLGGAGRRSIIAGSLLAIGGLLTLYYLVRPLDFWAPDPGPLSVALRPAGFVVTLSFVLLRPVIELKLVRDLALGSHDSHRRQSAFVLSGFIVAYSAYPLVRIVGILAKDPGALFPSGDTTQITANAAYLTNVLGLVAVLVIAWRARVKEAHFVALSAIAVIALAIITLVFPAGGGVATAEAIGFLAYPILLGYAILRFELFEIDPRLSRIAAFSAAGVTLASIFIVLTNILQGLIQNSLSGFVSSDIAAGAISALVVAAASAPISRWVIRAARRAFPELTPDELSQRRIEVYLHALLRALEDGVIVEQEDRVLRAMRDALGISEEEHARLMATAAAR